ncbi:hypothetical protein BDK51DRAFT_33330 [Blyttiomyces helicus]|uniref:Uncharacterized protein n=1 Tax=Blyttiomyces helicus TaxID=388810 RepID=A0A4P9WFR9_9FUNG|nr:hypothetical protein BDK51DRAFT_33330 [Blyttiomyces helicus]|eukprot:RKO91494.1 hypothetical protein BDK51DRAFT_33330 [Blyttiomyces helicus]
MDSMLRLAAAMGSWAVMALLGRQLRAPIWRYSRRDPLVPRWLASAVSASDPEDRPRYVPPSISKAITAVPKRERFSNTRNFSRRTFISASVTFRSLSERLTRTRCEATEVDPDEVRGDDGDLQGPNQGEENWEPGGAADEEVHGQKGPSPLFEVRSSQLVQERGELVEESQLSHATRDHLAELVDREVAPLHTLFCKVSAKREGNVGVGRPDVDVDLRNEWHLRIWGAGASGEGWGRAFGG